MAGAFTRANAASSPSGSAATRPRANSTSRISWARTGAGRLIDWRESQPLHPRGRSLSRGRARANPTIFYDGRGKARSAGEVYRSLVGRYDVARGGPANKAVAVAAARPAPANAGRRNPRNVGPGDPSRMPDPASAETYAAAARLIGPAGRECQHRSGVSRPVRAPARASRWRRWSARCGRPGAAWPFGARASPSRCRSRRRPNRARQRRARSVPGPVAGCRARCSAAGSEAPKDLLSNL